MPALPKLKAAQMILSIFVQCKGLFGGQCIYNTPYITYITNDEVERIFNSVVTVQFLEFKMPKVQSA